MNLNYNTYLIEKSESATTDFNSSQNQYKHQSSYRLAKNVKNNSRVNSLSTQKHKLNKINNNDNFNNNTNLQSIRLQIDLPMLRSTSPFNILDTKSADDYYNHYQKSSNDVSQSSSNSINTICLQIKLNTKATPLDDVKSNSESTLKNTKNVIKLLSNSSATSGYSSLCSSNSFINSTHDNAKQDEDLNNNSNSFFIDNVKNDINGNKSHQYTNYTTKKNGKDINHIESNFNNKNTNIYDRLNYSAKLSHIKSFSSNMRRLSLCSTSSSSSIASSLSNKSSNFQTNNYDEDCNVYEEISNFYENSDRIIDETNQKSENIIYDKLNDFTSFNSIFSITSDEITDEKSKYHRKEYSINDIFRNLYTIKQHANSQFKMEDSTSEQKPVYALKQIFEPTKSNLHNSKSNTNFLSSKFDKEKNDNLNHSEIMNMIKLSKDKRKNNKLHHSYENDRINKS
jgi:hypothetical protein